MDGKAQGISEDWLSLIIGLVVFVLALGLTVDLDILGWAVTTSVWTDLGKALAPVSKAYAGLGGVGSLIATYIGLLVLMTAGAAALKANIGRFILGFTVVFWLSYICWIIGSYANFAVNTPADMQKFGVSWSLRLTSEGGFIVALIAGLIVGNFLPGLAAWMKEAIRPELYIKIAIVILGGFLGIVSAEKLGLASQLMFLGLAVDHRRLSDLLVGRLLCGARLVQIQPRMGGSARVRHFRLRRVGGNRHGRRHPRPADDSDHGIVAGGDLCGDRTPDPAVHCGIFSRPAADGGRRVDGAIRQDRRCSGGERRYH